MMTDMMGVIVMSNRAPWRRYTCSGCKEIISYNMIDFHVGKHHKGKKLNFTEIDYEVQV